MAKLSIKPEQVVMISAGAAGIGRVVAETFLAHDCRVHICDIDEAAISDFINTNSNAPATKADVSDVAQVDKVFDDLQERYGRLDVLVNNAGISGPTAQAEDIEPAEWTRRWPSISMASSTVHEGRSPC
jgi:NAD(P)-dependent dehydrogenase (short-subunit alcohol dehydrogenase family)